MCATIVRTFKCVPLFFSRNILFLIYNLAQLKRVLHFQHLSDQYYHKVPLSLGCRNNVPSFALCIPNHESIAHVKRFFHDAAQRICNYFEPITQRAINRVHHDAHPGDNIDYNLTRNLASSRKDLITSMRAMGSHFSCAG